MKAPLLPVLLVLALAAFSVFYGGVEGAGVLALSGAFLVAFSLLLFRRSTTESHRGTNRRAQDDAQFLAMVVLVGIAVRAALTLGLRGAGVNEVIAPDEYTFHDNAQYFAAWVHGDVAQPFSYKFAGSTQVGYFALVGTLYAAIGEYPVVAVLLNCVVGGLCAYPAYRLASRISGRAAGRAAAVLVTFFPSLVLWSSLLIRDALVLFLLLWCACLAQSMMERFRIRGVVLFAVCLAALATLRSYLFVLTAGAVAVSFLVATVRRPGRAVVAAVVCGVAAIALMKVSGLGADYLSDASLQGIATRRRYNAIGGEGAIEIGEYDLSTPTGVITYLPVGIAWFLLSPFPWQFSGRQAFAIPEVVIWYVCIPLAATGAMFALRRRRRRALVPLFLGVFITLLYALVEGNVGIIFRHRAQALALFLPFAAIGWARRKSRERARRRGDAARSAARRTAPLPRPVVAAA